MIQIKEKRQINMRNWERIKFKRRMDEWMRKRKFSNMFKSANQQNLNINNGE
jgi:hypothetical protein